MALYRLQKAKAFHQNEINALIRAARINPLGLDWRRFIVALADDGQLIGCGQVKTHRDDSRELASLVVSTAWRGQGVARALIRRLLADHPSPLWLTCTATLVPFYTRFGFGEITNTALMPAYFRRVNRLFRLFTHLSPSINRLAVMRCDADELWLETAPPR